MSSISDLIISTAQQYGVDPSLAIEVATQESGINQNAVSPAGAIGVFQLEPATAAALGVDPYDLIQNIDGGVRYLAQMLAQFQDTATALAAYNWGPGNVVKALAQWGANFISHAPAETQNYVAKILGRLGSDWSPSVNVPAAVAAVGSSLTNAFNQAAPTTASKVLLLAGAGLAVYFAMDLILNP